MAQPAGATDAEDAALELQLLLDDVGVFLADVFGDDHAAVLSSGGYATVFSPQLEPLGEPVLTMSAKPFGVAGAPDLQLEGVVETIGEDATADSNASIAKELEKSRKSASKPKPKSTNQRQKEELVLLRATTSELQQELSILQSCRAISSNNTSGGSIDGTLLREGEAVDVRALSSLGATRWETLVKRQQKERVRAEKENAQLKDTLAVQVKFVKSLERRLRKRQMWEEVQGVKRHCFAKMTSQEAEIFSELARHSEARVVSFDQIFKTHGLGSRTIHYKPLNKAQVTFNDELGMHVNFIKASAMPFDFLGTADAIWKHMAAREVSLPHTTLTTEVIEQSEDSMATVRVVVMKKASCEAPRTTIYSVCNRIVQQDRVRLVWEAFIESRQGAQNGKLLVQLMHSGWIEVSRLKTEDGPTVALVQSYTRISPPTIPALQGPTDPGQLSLRHWRRTSAFTDRLISSYQENARLTHQLIENELMDNSFTTQGRS